MTVTFRCGHVWSGDPPKDRPICHCGETAIRDVTDATPIFRGQVWGPHSHYAPLEPAPVRLHEDEADRRE